MISEALGKVSLAKPYQERYGFPIEVDGGVNLGNLNRVRDVGADLLVAGSAVFKGGQPGRLFLELSEQLNR